ncbi:MAG: DUF433 domain-containing protein [Candidatus Woesearchaeota archaeon]|nr:DUF433 domain-containing protein [Candidatus Woesearchaeota archaeon]
MQERIVIDAEILRGKPIIGGTRISVELVLDLLASGMTVEEVIDDYPSLTREDILSALKYAAKIVKHDELHSLAETA